MSADAALYQISSSQEMDGHEFIRKEIVYLVDSNNSNYSSNLINYDTSSISNSGKWASFSEAYFVIPYSMTLTSNTDLTGVNVSPFIAGMKNGFWQIIDSMQVDLNGVNIIQQINYLNAYVTFRALSTWSENDQIKYGPSCGFFKDTATSVAYSGAAAANGDGLSNNRVYLQPAVVANTAVFTGSALNSGYVQRLLYTANSAAAGLNGVGAFYTAYATNGMPFFGNNGAAGAARVYYWSFLAKVRLRDLSDYFAKVPLLKGSFYRFTLGINSAVSTVTTVAAGPTMALTTVNLGARTNPMMVSSSAANQPTNTVVAGGAGGVFTFSCGISLTGATSILTGTRLYVPIYTMNPTYEEQYVTMNPTKTIVYNDLYSFYISNIAAGANFQYLLSNGITNPKHLVVIPLLNRAAGNNTVIAASELESPFSSCPGTTMPLGVIQNFQVQVSGVNLFSQQQQYDFDAFMSELSKTGINGGQTTPSLSSGLISEADFGYAFRYYLADISRRLPAEDAYPKSIQIQGINGSTKIMDLLTFVANQRAIIVNTLSGALVTE
jgi:hypothetical protein